MIKWGRLPRCGILSHLSPSPKGCFAQACWYGEGREEMQKREAKSAQSSFLCRYISILDPPFCSPPSLSLQSPRNLLKETDQTYTNLPSIHATTPPVLYLIMGPCTCNTCSHGASGNNCESCSCCSH